MDDNLLKYNYDDNQRVEPEWYLPIIPTVLVNGADGIGTGWASKIPNYDVRELISNIHRMLNGEEPRPMVSTARDPLDGRGASSPSVLPSAPKLQRLQGHHRPRGEQPVHQQRRGGHHRLHHHRDHRVACENLDAGESPVRRPLCAHEPGSDP